MEMGQTFANFWRTASKARTKNRHTILGGSIELRASRIAIKIALSIAFVAVVVCVLLVLQFANVFRSWGWGSLGACDRAWAYWEAGDADRALHWCDVAIRRDPQWSEPYYLRGTINESHGELELAAKDYVRAGDMMGDDSLQYVAAGRLYEKLGDVETAASLYSGVILADPRNIRHLEITAKVRAARDDPDALPKLRDFMGDAAKRKPQDKQLKRAWSFLRDAAARIGAPQPNDHRDPSLPRH